MLRCIVSDLEIYTDGGCHGNPGPGGWAFVASHDKRVHEASGHALDTTNNRMELEAVIQALGYAASVGPVRVRIVTDSQYVRNGITSWIKNWLRNGWKTAAKKPVKNKEYWMRLYDLNESVGPQWDWVKGHSGNPLNERCDELVQTEIARIE